MQKTIWGTQPVVFLLGGAYDMLQHITQKCKTRLFFFTFFLSMFGNTMGSAFQEKQVIGWLERARICPENLTFTAKLDTGAKNSSLNVQNSKEFERSGQRWIQFDVVDRYGTKKVIEKRLLRVATVKQDYGAPDKRPAVMLGICLGNHYREVEVNLNDRSEYNYQLLLGRSFIKDLFLIDPSAQFTTKPNCPIPCGP